MRKRFLIVTRSPTGISETHPMKEWLRKHPEQLPHHFTPHHKTSHQLRNELSRMGWLVQETEHEVRLLQPDMSRNATELSGVNRSTAGAIGPIDRFLKFQTEVQQLIDRLQILETSINGLLPLVDRINNLVREQYKPNERRVDFRLSESERADAQSEWENRQKEIDKLCQVLKESQPGIFAFSRDLQGLLARIPMSPQLLELREEINSLGFPRTIDPRLKELNFKETAELMSIVKLRLEDMSEIAHQADTTSVQAQKNERTVPRYPLEIFCSYSHKDERLRQQLQAHLAVLLNEGLISAWHDRLISPGSEWKRAIDAHLHTSGIILLLVSVDFLASNYCQDVEVKTALERHKQGSARVIPIILRYCDWKNSPIGKLQALPKDGKPVVSWPNRDLGFTDVVMGIRAVLRELNSPSLHQK